MAAGRSPEVISTIQTTVAKLGPLDPGPARESEQGGISVSDWIQFELAYTDLARAMNQQGTISPPKCERSQNGRGGLFFVVDDKALFDSVTDLLEGETAPSRKPKN